MTHWDFLVIAGYFLAVLGLGFWYKRRASESLEAYFLGGRRLPWWALAMSGSVSNFDITGTMWIVSVLFVLGMKSMWHHWMWGFLMGAFFLAYMGKWVRRSRVLTAAEWMKTRFGDGRAGRLARTVYALMAILTQASFLGYAFQGIGKFAAVYIPLEGLAEHTSIPWLRSLLVNYEAQILAVVIIALTTLYVILGGLFSVVVTDVVQTVILTFSSLLIAYLAWSRMNPEALQRLPEGFMSLRVPWRIPELAGTEHSMFTMFGALVLVWVLKGFLLNAGGPAQMYDFQRFLAARSDRDAAKIGASWSLFLVVRWAMAMGIVLLALTGAVGVTDSEQVMPAVLRDFLPSGVRGLVVAGLLAAFMSTFSSTVNSGASFIVRDIWQTYIRPKSSDRQALRFSYLATLLLVFLGIGIGFQGTSIADIWNWMMMALGAGVIVPNVLRWYWWRMNGWGYASGTLGGLLLSLGALFVKQAPDYLVFPLVVSASTLACVLGSLLTPPVPHSVLSKFYETVRPFGLWKPVASRSSLPEKPKPRSERTMRILGNTSLGMLAVFAFYVAPMYLVGHAYGRAGMWAAAGVLAVIILRFTWYGSLTKEPPSRLP
jgi:SSS family solute:Na+ symporter